MFDRLSEFLHELKTNQELKAEMAKINLFDPEAIDKFLPVAKKYGYEFQKEEISMLLQSFNFIPGDQKMSKEDIMKVAKDYMN